MDNTEIKEAMEKLTKIASILESHSQTPPANGNPQETDLSYKSEPGSVRMLEDYDDEKKKKEKKVKRMEVKLLAEGWSKNGYYYSREVAESLAHLINSSGRRKMYIDHQDMFFSTPSRKLKEFAAVIVECYAKEGASYAIVESTGNPMTDWIFEFAERHPKEIGASIDARAKVEEVDEPEDEEKKKDRWNVKELTFVNSVDFVSYASAGGEVVSALAQEALQIMESYVEQNKELISTYSANVEPDKGKGGDTQPTKEGEEPKTSSTQSKNTNKKESNMDGKEKVTLESLKAEHPDILNSLREEITKEVKKEFNAEKETKGLKEQVSNLEQEVKTVKEERDTLKQKVDDFEVKEAIEKRRKRIGELISEYELPEQAVTETFKKDLEKFEKEEDIVERIKDRKEFISNFDGEVLGNGPRNTQESDKGKGEDTELSEEALVAGIKS